MCCVYDTEIPYRSFYRHFPFSRVLILTQYFHPPRNNMSSLLKGQGGSYVRTKTFEVSSVRLFVWNYLPLPAFVRHEGLIGGRREITFRDPHLLLRLLVTTWAVRWRDG